MNIKDDVTIRSWDGTWTYRPKVLVTPQTVEDIVEIVKSVVRFPSPVRPAGSMHGVTCCRRRTMRSRWQGYGTGMKRKVRRATKACWPMKWPRNC